MKLIEKIEQLSQIKQLPNVFELFNNNILTLQAKQLEYCQRDGAYLQHIPAPTPEMQLAAVQSNGLAIKFIPKPNFKIRMTAVMQNGLALKYIHNACQKIQDAAIKQNAYALVFINQPNKEQQINAIKQNPEIISLINQPDEELQLTALRIDVNTFRYFTKLHEKAQDQVLDNINKVTGTLDTQIFERQKITNLFFVNPDSCIKFENVHESDYCTAIKSNPNIIHQIPKQFQNKSRLQLQCLEKNIDALNPIPMTPTANLWYAHHKQLPVTKEMQITALQELDTLIDHDEFFELVDSTDADIRHLMHQLCKRGCVSYNALEEHINNFTYEQQVELVGRKSFLLTSITKQTEELQLIALKGYFNFSIKDLKDPSKLVLKTFLERKPDAIQEIVNPDEELQLTAVKKDGHCLRFLKNPNETVQWAALKEKSYAIKHIPNPTEEMQLYALEQDMDNITNIPKHIQTYQVALKASRIKSYGGRLKYDCDINWDILTQTKPTKLPLIKILIGLALLTLGIYYKLFLLTGLGILLIISLIIVAIYKKVT